MAPSGTLGSRELTGMLILAVILGAGYDSVARQSRTGTSAGRVIGEEISPDLAALGPAWLGWAERGSGTRTRPLHLRDWADSVVVPAWVLRGTGGSGGQAGEGRLYTPLGTGSARAARPAPSEAPVQALPLSWETVLGGGAHEASSLALLRRSDEGGTTLTPLDASAAARARVGSRWSLAGDCTSTFAVSGVSGASGDVALEDGARSLGGLPWRAALTVPASECERGGHRAVPRSVPDDTEREVLFGEVLSSPRVRGLGVSDFRPEDFTVVHRASGPDVHWRWGVLRQRNRSTQLYPPPPALTLVFLARSHTAHGWEVVWARLQDERVESVELAGVHDSGGDGVPEALLVVEKPGGEGPALLRVAPDGQGRWSERAVLAHTAAAP